MTATELPTLAEGRWAARPGEATAAFTVRNWGLARVRGRFAVTGGTVTVAGGRPVAATAALDAASVRTGIARRDTDLVGRRFLHAARHPEIALRCDTVVPDGEGWRAEGVLAVAGGEAPLTLHVVRLPATVPGTVRVRATGVLDRTATPLRAPRLLIGRDVAIEVEATLRLT